MNMLRLCGKPLNAKRMGDYHNLYSDVLILTDVFENFRKT